MVPLCVPTSVLTHPLRPQLQKLRHTRPTAHPPVLQAPEPLHTLFSLPQGPSLGSAGVIPTDASRPACTVTLSLHSMHSPLLLGFFPSVTTLFCPKAVSWGGRLSYLSPQPPAS